MNQRNEMKSPLLEPPLFLGAASPSRVSHQSESPQAKPLNCKQSDTASQSFQSYSYDPWYSSVYEAFVFAKQNWDFTKVTLLRWGVNFLIGCCVAIVAIFITYTSRQFTTAKFQALTALIDIEEQDARFTGVALFGFVLISVGYAAISSMPISFVEPIASGSGIPEIKTVLNGVALPRVLRLKTLVCKVLSVVFSVASGLPVGKEGPMVHSGASIAAGITQGKSRTFGFDTRWTVHEAFRNDKEKRDFISCGAAAGVAAAFGAPVGGLLFAVEEGTTHWFRALVWRIFFCTMVASFVLDFFNSGIQNQWGDLGNPGMFNFGAFGSGAVWRIQELPLYVLIGAYGGLQGGAFNYVNSHLSLWRFTYVPVSKPWRRFFEVLILSTVVSASTFGVSYLYASCKPRPSPDSAEPYISDLVSFYCSNSDYNELASLFMVSSENAIKQLFHSKSTFRLGHLAVFYLVYTILSCLTYGISVASGLFIPSLLSGSAMGRFIGECLKLCGFSVDAGTFSLIGAAAVLGGTTRMTVSLAVILLETTGNYQLGLPLMVALVTARFVGNLFGEGIYDLHIRLRGWPLLPEHLPKLLAARLRVRDVMSKAPRMFEEIERVGDVLDLLQSTTHNGFPVVYTSAVMRTYSRIGSLAGLIQRKHLAVLLLQKAFHAELPTVPFHDTGENDNPGPSALAAYSIALEGSPHKRADARKQALPLSPLMAPDSPRIGPRRTGASFILRDHASMSESRPRTGTRGDPVLLRLPSAAGGLVQGLIHDSGSGGGLPPLRTSSFVVPGLGRSVNNSSMQDLSAVSDAALNAADVPERLFDAGGDDVLEMLYTDEPLVNFTDIESCYPHYPDVSRLRLSEAERAMYIDLRPYLNPTPATVHVHTPLTAAYEVFKALALRHLIVVNDCHDVVGIITRHDLLVSCLQRHATSIPGSKR